MMSVGVVGLVVLTPRWVSVTLFRFLGLCQYGAAGLVVLC